MSKIDTKGAVDVVEEGVAFVELDEDEAEAIRALCRDSGAAAVELLPVPDTVTMQNSEKAQVAANSSPAQVSETPAIHREFQQVPPSDIYRIAKYLAQGKLFFAFQQIGKLEMKNPDAQGFWRLGSGNYMITDQAAVDKIAGDSKNFGRDAEALRRVLGEGSLGQVPISAPWIATRRPSNEILRSPKNELLRQSALRTAAAEHIYNVRKAIGQEIDPFDFMRNFTSRVIGQLMIGADPDEKQKNFLDVLVSKIPSIEAGGVKILTGPGGFIENKKWRDLFIRIFHKEFHKDMGEIEKAIESLWKIHNQQNFAPSESNQVRHYLDILKRDEKKLTPEQLIGSIITFFLAGTTTAVDALTWGIYLRTVYPDFVPDGMNKEIEQYANSIDNDVSKMAIKYQDLPLCREFILKVLYLYGPAFTILRKTNNKVTIDGYTFEEGDRLFLTTHDPKLPDPSQGNPVEMIRGVSKEELRRRSHFGKGPGMCPARGTQEPDEGFAMDLILTSLIAQHIAGIEFRADKIPPLVGNVTMSPVPGAKISVVQKSK